jgi:hypothetical protein
MAHQENLQRYAGQLRASLAAGQKTVEALDELLVLQERLGISDPVGQQEIRFEIIQQSAFVDRYTITCGR